MLGLPVMSLPVVDISHAHCELTTSGAGSLSFSPGALCPAPEEPTPRVQSSLEVSAGDGARD